MSVEKYHSVEEMPGPVVVTGSELIRRIAAVWYTAHQLARRRYPHAVLKFRSIEEAQAARQQWERENGGNRKE